jgi:CBS domain-containing protein
MHTVKELLREKGHQVWTIAPQATVYEALELMAAKNSGSLVVVEHGDVAGVFTERDYARKGILQGRSNGCATCRSWKMASWPALYPSATL